MIWTPDKRIVTPRNRQGGFLLNPFRFGGGGGGGDDVDPHFDKVTALLKFDGEDESTTISDEVGVINWTAQNDAQLDTSEKRFGLSALLLNGTNAYVTAGLAPGLAMGEEDLTVELFARIASNSETRVFIDTRSGPTDTGGFAFFNHSSGRIRVNVGNSTVAESAGSITEDQWDHVAATRENGTWRIFIVGDLDGTGSNSSNLSSSNNVTIGRSQSGSAYFQGHIDEMRFTKGVARYTASFTPPSAPFPTVGP
jgi:hypothetical protein